jgi:hypothetical protein
MKNILVIIIITISLSCSDTKLYAQQPAPTDTLGWLKANIEANSSYYVGKPLSILLDTLNAHSLLSAIVDYMRPHISDGAAANTLPGDTVWTNRISIYFQPIFDEGVKQQMHDVDWNVNTHVPVVRLTFTQRIPFLTSLAKNVHIGTLFGPVQGLCRPYIVASIKVGEW